MTRTRVVLLVTIGLLVVAAAMVGGWLVSRANNQPLVPAIPVAATPEADAPLTIEQERWLDEMAPWLPALRSDHARALRNAEGTCLDIKQGKSEPIVVDNTRKRFGGAEPISRGNAGRIVVALEKHLVCATFDLP